MTRYLIQCYLQVMEFVALSMPENMPVSVFLAQLGYFPFNPSSFMNIIIKKNKKEVNYKSIKDTKVYPSSTLIISDMKS